MLDVHVYGIRHHGPGSARAVLDALARDKPDVLVVEMPADLEKILNHLGHEEMIPPVSMVAYDSQAVQHALFYPMTRFSPEWVAMRWALKHDIPIKAMDLPASLMVASTKREQELLFKAGSTSDYESNYTKGLRADPLGALAKIAGYDDRERWWERTFELLNPGADVFPSVSEMIATLRAAYPEASSGDCRFREMHMARTLLQVEKNGFKRASVVCGAWHAPVLGKAELKNTAKGYAAAKRGLKGPKLVATWVPYTYDRLRMKGGYGAGVLSPIWYGLLFDDPATAPEHYLTLIARTLREMGHAASTAQVVDATELADQLSSLRGLSLPGLEEIKEASIGALADGSDLRLEEVLRKVESLQTSGRVPSSMTGLPLQKDLEARLKATRLMKPYRDMEKVSKDLDLRKPKHLEASQLLCQLLLLGIPFGDKEEAARGAQGTFKETWTLHWQPDYALRLLTCHTYGQRVKEAAAAALRERLDQEPELPSLTAAVDLVILAGLFDQMDDVTRRIKQRAIEAVEIWKVAAALPTLLRLARYRSLRLQETDYIVSLTHVLIPKLSTGLLPACQGIDDDAAYDAFRLLKLLQPYLAMEQKDRLVELWHSALLQVTYGKSVHPLVAGFSLRVLADAEAMRPDEVSTWVKANLGAGVQLNHASLFMEGFLFSSGLVLIHRPTLFKLIDSWIDTLSEDEFRTLLPALRRVFAQFSVSERRKIRMLARKVTDDLPFENESTNYDPRVVNLVSRWLA